MMYDCVCLILIYDGEVLMGVLLELLFVFLLMMRCHQLYVMLWLQPSSIAGSCCQPSCLAFALKLSMLCIQVIHLFVVKQQYRFIANLQVYVNRKA